MRIVNTKSLWILREFCLPFTWSRLYVHIHLYFNCCVGEFSTFLLYWNISTFEIKSVLQCRKKSNFISTKKNITDLLLRASCFGVWNLVALAGKLLTPCVMLSPQKYWQITHLWSLRRLLWPDWYTLSI